MTLTERYLKAVAAQLPKASREDIVAELRDVLQTRMEDREEELGRPLTEADEEAVLREFGHPLSVAARYGSGPQHIVGPELYPWWMFGVKVGLMALVCITAIGAIVRVLVGDEEVGRAIGQAFHSVFTGGITIIGLATIAGFIIERQKEKPAFLRDWRVKDLGLFELAGMDADAVSRHVAGTVETPRQGRRRGQMTLSPAARALGSAAAWTVLLLWWVGFLMVSPVRPEDLFPQGVATVGGVDYADIFRRILAMLYWPGVAYAACRIGFDLIRAANPAQVRFTALGDLGFGAAQAWLFYWLWMASPLAPVIHVDNAQAFIDRIRAAFEGGWWSVSTILMACVVFGLLQALFKMSGALWRLITGQLMPYDRRRRDAVAA
ncbi:HAAS signaling domain-containing protein [Brevundimonas goettingensis]|uniref:Uncharacterized protein n=1 Tax=Brevundimonas goettingensis TaxID=2774190 RepID=A0A975GUJ8_9CAUL|nr:hypothetical protein [Brevundimonas goettingensis]QTC90207.1 hypothetical protein IFJ75_13060 [Brevundimonas goettingensis]